MTEKEVIEKEVLIQVSPTVRVIQYNVYNTAIEKLETIPEGRLKGVAYPERDHWAFKGFYSNKIQALEGVLQQDLLDNDSEALELVDFVQQIKETMRYTVEQLRGMLG